MTKEIGTANPALRLLALSGRYKFFIFFGLVFGSGTSFLSGLMSPIIFRSQATIKVDTPFRYDIRNPNSYVDPYSEKHMALKNAKFRVLSGRILEQVGEALLKEETYWELAFPNSLKITNLGSRVELMSRRLSNRLFQSGVHLSSNKIESDTDTAELADHLRHHLSVTLDAENNIMNLYTEAGDPHVARLITSLLTDVFIKDTYQLDREEMNRKEQYLIDTIRNQQVKISSVELKLRKINQQYPEIALENLQGPARSSSYALKYVQIKDSLLKTESEISTTKKLIEKYSEIISTLDPMNDLGGFSVNEKFRKEIGELEFKKIEYTQVLNYPLNHPTITTLDKRISKLREILANIQQSNGNDSKQSRLANRRVLQEDVFRLNSKLDELNVKKNVLLESLDAEVEKLQGGLEIESEAASLVRSLTAHIDVLSNLRRTLEDLRVQIVGTSDSAKVISEANLPVNQSSISLEKRVFFGGIVGMALVISLLFIWDFSRPRFLIFEDVDQLGLRHFGKFSYSYHSIVKFGSALMTLRAEDQKSVEASRMVLFSSVGATTSLTSWVMELASLIGSSGEKAAVVYISSAFNEQKFKFAKIDDIQTTSIHPEELPYVYDQLFNRLKCDYDWVLVSSFEDEISPSVAFLQKKADIIFHTTCFGETFISDIQHSRHFVGKEHGDEYALIISKDYAA